MTDNPVFHPCPGSVPQDAWMNIVLVQGDGYDGNASVTLSGADLHNLIILTTEAQAKAIVDLGLETSLVWAELSERLDRAFVRSLRGKG